MNSSRFATRDPERRSATDVQPAARAAEPLLVTADDRTARKLAALAAAAGVRCRHVADVESALPHWTSASLVVVGADLAVACADARPPARDGVVLLVGDRLPYDQAWPLALTMGADQVVSLPEATDWLTERLVPKRRTTSRGGLIAVTGARGGVGASTLAASVALAAGRRRDTATLIDADPHGGGLDVMLGWEQIAGSRWPKLAGLDGPFDPWRWRDCLPRRDGVALLSVDGDNPATVDPVTVSAVLDVSRASSAVTVVDLPRLDGSMAPAVTGIDLLVVVVPAEVRAVAAARVVIARYAARSRRVCAVVRLPSPGRLSSRDVASAIGVPLVAELGADTKVPRAAEYGRLSGRLRKGTFAAVADTVLDCGARAIEEPPSLERAA